MTLTEPIRYWAHPIVNLSDTQRITQTQKISKTAHTVLYQIPTEPTRCGTYQILSYQISILLDIEPIRYWTYKPRRSALAVQILRWPPTPSSTPPQPPFLLPAHDDRQPYQCPVAKLATKKVHPSPLSPSQPKRTADSSPRVLWQIWGRKRSTPVHSPPPRQIPLSMQCDESVSSRLVSPHGGKKKFNIW